MDNNPKKQQRTMNHITKDHFKELAVINKPHCISIFIPTHRAGKEVNEKIDQIDLKNQVQEIKKELEKWQLDPKDISHLLAPVNELVEDTTFWNNQSDGLAIFRHHDLFEVYTLPVYFTDYYYLSDHFYLKPLVPYLNDDARFYMLSLSLSSVKFFECFPHHITEIEVQDLLPEKLEEEVGYDYTEKHLQFRSGQVGDGSYAMYHGHGAGTDDEKKEILKFMRAVNKGIMQFLHDKKSPLIIATVDYLYPIYKEANHYKYLWDDFIAGNPEYEEPVALHEKGKYMLDNHFYQHKKKMLNAFEHTLSSNLASYKEDEIIPAAYNQRIDTLFVKNNQEKWGIYNKENNTIIPREKQSQFKTDLLNFATVNTILNGGDVYLTEPEEMPHPDSNLNAIFRF